jgi:hypothetical protein
VFHFSFAAQHLSQPICDDSTKRTNAPYHFTTIQLGLVRVSVYHIYTMSHYRYSPLSTGPDSIRLLRLMPHKDETASVQCQLFNYSIQESGKKTHLYEALSYAWGGSDKLQSISIDKYNLPVTVNLHATLSRLRDCFFERIIWVDAICINQVDLKEQGLQVQLMAKIYSKATRVIVWLGEMEPDSDQALEDIRLAANAESMERSKKEINQQVILNLLQRPWFQRIWVREQTPNYNHQTTLTQLI